MNLHEMNLRHIIFIDIETVSEYKTFAELDPIFKPLWIRKAKSLEQGLDISNEEEIERIYQGRAGIYAEFGKIICISLGILTKEGQLRIKTFSSNDEQKVIEDFAMLLQEYYNDIDTFGISGHNIKEFDIPYLCRRMLKHGIKLPALLDISAKKPWQTPHLIDTMDVWRFGDYKAYTSLALICAVMGIQSPKSDMDGSMVGHAYWFEERLSDIAKYCSNDVEAVAKLIIKFSQQDYEIQEVIHIPHE